MRVSTPYLLILAGYASARDAVVYIANSPSSAHVAPPSSLSPPGARLVFAELLGLAEFHQLGDADGATVQALNAFGNAADGLFGQDSTANKQKSFVVVDGFEHAKDILPPALAEAPSFRLTDLPPHDQNEQLVKDLAIQDTWLARHAQTSANSFTTSLSAGIVSQTSHQSDKAARQAIDELLSNSGTQIVIVSQPEERLASRSSSTWGAYRVPRQHAQDMSAAAHEMLAEFEADLDDFAHSAKSGHGSGSTLEDDLQREDNTTAPRGILPYCYSSLSECQKTTNKCSGHGSCESQYKYSDDQGTKECFACTCRTTVEELKDGGKRQTAWAGPACQKQDISSPFWLLTGTTVTLLLVVSWGVGLLFTVGSEDLPSVIGAGVAGPRASR